MTGEVLADIAFAVDDSQQVALDQRRERLLVHGQHPGKRRIQLQDADPVVRDEFIEPVEGADERDISGAQDQSDAAALGGASLGQPSGRAHLVDPNTRRHPDLPRETVEQQCFLCAMRQYLESDATARRLTDRNAVKRIAAGSHSGQGLRGGRQRRHGDVGPGQPLLAVHGRRGLFDLDCRLGPLGGGVAHGVAGAQEQGSAFVEGHGCPRACPAAELVDLPIERRVVHRVRHGGHTHQVWHL
ncbi:hypothetical protein [Gordonia sp. SID5947]|uniref:hypothetical protein n=1 Tax=Gordonia sp. SID5947 TaxID=2690315 RepID=UPI001F3205AC|nr:hypothetical protein [Gordonia sp. SID5947]